MNKRLCLAKVVLLNTHFALHHLSTIPNSSLPIIWKNCHVKEVSYISWQTYHEESYTSKCSFLDNEEICKHGDYLGRRIKRGLFKTAQGKIINADVNGSFNIMRKAIPNAFANGIEGLGVNPIVLTIKK